MLTTAAPTSQPSGLCLEPIEPTSSQGDDPCATSSVAGVAVETLPCPSPSEKQKAAREKSSEKPKKDPSMFMTATVSGLIPDEAHKRGTPPRSVEDSPTAMTKIPKKSLDVTPRSTLRRRAVSTNTRAARSIDQMVFSEYEDMRKQAVTKLRDHKALLSWPVVRRLSHSLAARPIVMIDKSEENEPPGQRKDSLFGQQEFGENFRGKFDMHEDEQTAQDNGDAWQDDPGIRVSLATDVEDLEDDDCFDALESASFSSIDSSDGDALPVQRVATMHDLPKASDFMKKNRNKFQTW
eukprot:CAMPEP_0117473422 /NCGR_PEP_ID=MMETSP0784-20121206/8764_1 /TAXON_ID=39447 /ORGANISM="" /LENGTH=293 /DNA_ID=CAMNT_0005267623 /DNA_START=16 /DNA_END=894 /DNA_ORIENTATION=-